MINIFNVAGYGYSGGATPAPLDAAGYPVQNFTGIIAGQIGPVSQTLSTTGPWIFGWEAGRSCFTINFQQSGTVTNIPSGVTVVNGSGTGNVAITGNCGVAGSVTINWTTTAGVAYQWNGTYTQWNSNTSGKFYLIRQSDQAAFNNGILPTSEFVNFIGAQGLYAGVLRMMGWNILNSGIGTNVVNFGYRKTLSSFSFFNTSGDYPPGTRCGGTTSFCTIVVSGGNLTAAAAADSNLSGWTDGEQITGNVASAVQSLTIASSITFTGSGSGTNLTVSGVTGTIVFPLFISGAGVPSSPPTHIISQTSGTPGGAGVYVTDNATTSSGASLSGGAVINNGGNCQLTVPSTANLTNGQTIVTAFINGASECNSNAAFKTTILTIDNPNQITINLAKAGGLYTGGGGVGYQTLAVTGKSAPAKIILNAIAVPVGANFDTLVAGFSTFTYNATLDAVLYQAGGITNGPPLEFQVQLANLVNAHLWYNIPTWANDSFVINTDNLIYGSLNGNLGYKTERSNECWNFGQRCAQWMAQMGIALGITPNSSAASPNNFQALRARLDNGNLHPSSNWGTSSRLDRLYCFQGGFGGTSFLTAQLQGTSLVSPGTAAYQAYAGGSAVNFNTAPNRPEDFTNDICYAPYSGGGTMFSGQSPDAFYAPTSFDAPILQAAVNNYNAGGAGITAAIATVDQAVRGDLLNRVQTVTGASTTFTTPAVHNLSQFDVVRFTVSGGTSYSGLNLLSSYQILSVPTSTTFTAGQVVAGVTGSAVNAGTAGTGTTSVGYQASGSNANPQSGLNVFNVMSGWFTKYQSVVAGVNASRQNGLGPMGTQQYEAALEPTASTTAQCTAIGINSTDCTTLGTIIVAWKNDPMSAATLQYYYQAYMGQATNTITTGAMPNSIAPSWLVVNGVSLYSLNSNTSFVSSAPYQLYTGFRNFSTP